jgi:hypothetical protein
MHWKNYPFEQKQTVSKPDNMFGQANYEGFYKATGKNYSIGQTTEGQTKQNDDSIAPANSQYKMTGSVAS